MPNFTNAPPEPDGERALPLRRTPANGQLRAVITCQDLIGCNTHFYGGHTIPCEGDGCEACEKGIPWRWHGWVSAVRSQTHLHFLFEFTAQVGESLRDYFKLQQTLRGCIITAERMHHRPNGRVILQATPGDLAQLNMPEPPDVEACLRIIWHLPPIGKPVTLDEHGKKLLHVGKDERILQDRIGSQRSNGRTVN